MKSRILALALIVCAFTSAPAQLRPRPGAAPAPAPTTNTATGQTLPIRRVILYSNGVAYIERRGTVTGRAEINLSFKQSQVDDVLKSMVVLDLGQGRIGAVSYNSSAPPAARMADIPFAVESKTGEGGGLAGVLSQLQGAKVLVTTGTRTATGAILTVEERKEQIDAQKPAVVKHALVLSSEGGELASFDLAEVRSVKLLDEGTRKDISEFADATASARRRDAKTITVTSDGNGAREMVVSYTIAAPIWKTNYRVVLDQSGKPFFQGWAIVDNVSDEDWENVQLSLVSGTPISFIQPIQKPFYRYRPVIPIPGDLQLTPQVYEPGNGEAISSITGHVTDVNGAAIPGASVIATNDETNEQFSTATAGDGSFSLNAKAGSYKVRISSPGFKDAVVGDVEAETGRTANVNLSLEAGTVSETVTISSGSVRAGQRVDNRQILNLPQGNFSQNMAILNPGTGSGEFGASSTTISSAITSGNSGIDAAATGQEVGDLFEYRIEQPITVRRDRSALIPIVQLKMDGERTSIYNEGVRRDRPMGGLLLKNTSPLTLESGAVTVLDGDAYAGEALMERLKPNEQRLISFALDLGTLVVVRPKQDREPTFMVRALNGVFQAHYYQTDEKLYQLTNQTDKPRTVYIEHPVRQGWEISKNSDQPVSTTQRYHRFRVELKGRENRTVRVVERRALMDTYQISNFTRQDLELFISRRYIDDATRAALEKIIDLKSRIAGVDARIGQLDAETGEITKDQARFRENIEALSKTPEAKTLITRYIAKADTQESRLEQITKDKKAALDERGRLYQELESTVRGLVLDRSL